MSFKQLDFKKEFPALNFLYRSVYYKYTAVHSRITYCLKPHEFMQMVRYKLVCLIIPKLCYTKKQSTSKIVSKKRAVLQNATHSCHPKKLLSFKYNNNYFLKTKIPRHNSAPPYFIIYSPCFI